MINEEHKTAVVLWEAQKTAWMEQHLPRKKWLPKPIRPKKPKIQDYLPADCDAEEDTDEDAEDDELESIYDEYRT